MHDKKPLNKINYTTHQSSSMPEKFAVYDETENYRDSEMEECPSDKECKYSIPENPTQIILLSCRKCMQGICGYYDDYFA